MAKTVCAEMAGEQDIGAEMSAVQERLTSATGARTTPPSQADFALISAAEADGEVLNLKRGTLERSENGATAIYALERLSTDGPLTLELSGPGVFGQRRLGVEGLSATEAQAIQSSRAPWRS